MRRPRWCVDLLNQFSIAIHDLNILKVNGIIMQVNLYEILGWIRIDAYIFLYQSAILDGIVRISHSDISLDVQPKPCLLVVIIDDEVIDVTFFSIYMSHVIIITLIAPAAFEVII